VIFDKIEHRAFYGNKSKLAELLLYMSKITIENFPGETVRLDGDRLYANPVRLATKLEEECRFESHRRYADVHYIVAGREKIVVKDIGQVCVCQTYDPQDDICFYNGEGGVACILEPGCFLVCYPQDAHKVNIAVDGPETVTKLVGKFELY
jgi:YhcH/YjgK/YiaL family protein